MKRDATQIIWRTVVFAGAMLGAPACSKNKPPAPLPPSNTAAATHGGDPNMAPTKPNTTANGAADPCDGSAPADPRPRGTDDDGGGGTGRGFVLS